MGLKKPPQSRRDDAELGKEYLAPFHDRFIRPALTASTRSSNAWRQPTRPPL